MLYILIELVVGVEVLVVGLIGEVNIGFLIVFFIVYFVKI